MALRCMAPPIFSVRGIGRPFAIGFERYQPVTGHLFFGRAQYASGSKKVRFPALSNEILELSSVYT